MKECIDIPPEFSPIAIPSRFVKRFLDVRDGDEIVVIERTPWTVILGNVVRLCMRLKGGILLFEGVRDLKYLSVKRLGPSIQCKGYFVFEYNRKIKRWMITRREPRYFLHVYYSQRFMDIKTDGCVWRRDIVMPGMYLTIMILRPVAAITVCVKEDTDCYTCDYIRITFPPRYKTVVEWI